MAKTKPKRKPAPKKQVKRKPTPKKKGKSRAKRRSPKPVVRNKTKKQTARKSPGRSKRKTKNRSSGFGSRIKVHSRLVGETTIRRSTRYFAQGIKASRGLGGGDALKKVCIPVAVSHFQKLGKSKKSLYYFKLIYEYRFKAKNIESQFSIGTVKLKTKGQVAMHVSDLVDAFIGKLSLYSKAKFTKITVTGFVSQAYT